VTTAATRGTALASPPAGLTEAQLCALGGARLEDQPHGDKTLVVEAGSDAH
jgi:hypothetical protein